MTKRILFSPAGNTDPIKSGYDGGILHICRHYKVDEVYLYLSQDILEHQNEDQRYTRAIEHLGKLQNREIKCHLIERPNLSDPHLFNYFYEDFYKELVKIQESLSPDDELLLNVSSGTPAMKSAILCIATLKNLTCKIMQVANPAPKQDKRFEKPFTDEILENNLDDLPGEKVRVEEISCPELAYYNEENSIIKLVKAYSYKAALELAKTLPQRKTQHYLPYLELAVAREALNLKKAISLEIKLKTKTFPIKNDDQIKVFEYALNAQLKLNRDEFTDYVRSLTPLTTDLFERILKQQGFDLTKFTKFDGSKRIWDRVFISNNKDTDSLAKAIYDGARMKNNPNYNDITTDSLNKIIQTMIDDTQIVKLSNNLREVEKELRNRAAHEIISINEKKFTALTGKSPKEIMEDIKKAISYTDIGLDFTDPAWNSYEKLNEIIISKINEPVEKA